MSAEPRRARERSESYYDTRSQVFSALIDTIDLSQLARLDPESAREEIRDIVNDIIAIKNFAMTIAEQEELLEDICNDVLGYGPLEPLLARDDIADIMVNGARNVYIEVNGKVEQTSIRFRDNQQLLNIWASYAKGPITAAAEYNMLISWNLAGVGNDESGHGWLAMANYKFTDVFATTLRYSGIVLGDGDPDQEVTVSPSLALSPNWLALAEYRFNIDSSIQSYAVESTFSF